MGTNLHQTSLLFCYESHKAPEYTTGGRIGSVTLIFVIKSGTGTTDGFFLFFYDNLIFAIFVVDWLDKFRFEILEMMSYISGSISTT